MTIEQMIEELQRLAASHPGATVTVCTDRHDGRTYAVDSVVVNEGSVALGDDEITIWAPA